MMKNMKKLFCLVLAAAMLLSVMAGCASKTETSTAASETTESASSETASTESGETAATDGEITIAFIGNTTGDYAQYGIPVRNAVMMYFDQLNAAGGINGKKVVVKEYDDKGDGVEAVNAYNLAKENGITAVIGSVLTGATIALADATYEDNMPQITASATATGVTVMEDTGEVRTNVFRACFIDPYQGAAAATYAFENLGFKKAAVLMDMTNDYAVGLSSFFARSFKKLGGEVVANLKYSSGDQDFTAQLTELISKKPDIVFMPAYFAEGAIIMKQARELGATFRLMGADAMDNPDTVKLGGKAAEGFLHTTFPYDPQMTNMSPEAKRFTEAWKAAYPDKETNVNGALGYNCYFLIVDAIKRANSADPQAIAKALAETKGLPTALGKLSINKNHDAEMPVGIIEYKNGQRVYVGEVTPK